jgi:5S rRNA maturation endonuclease (ribonuclease M5)
MRYKGREVNAVEFWGRYVEFPSTMRIDREDMFTPKVTCPNPDHDTLKHHFQINLKEPKVHCFAHCGISGSWEHAICVIEGIYERLGVDLEAVRSAWDKNSAKRSEIEREQIRRYARAKREASKIILKSAGGKFSKISPTASVSKPQSTPTVSADDLSYETYLPPTAQEYVDARGITGESISAWQLGWLPEERRLVIPARDENGRLKFLIKRAIRAQDQPKYLYTEGYPKTSLLFGACQIDLGMIKSHGLIVVEGSLDTILNHQDNLPNTVGILGTGISEQQRRIIARIKPPKIFLMFDKDSAGVHNIQIAAEKLRKYPLFVVKYPKGKSDPAEMNRAEKFRQIDRSIPIYRFIHETGLNVRRKERESTWQR